MKRILLLLFLLFFTFSIQGIDITHGYIFINSTPIRAKVLVDGLDKGLLTPCIVRNLGSLRKKVTITKEGYKDNILDLAKIKTKKIDIYLTPNSFDLYFPERIPYRIDNTQLRGPLYLSKLKGGNYSIKILNDKISFKRESPFLPAEISIGTSLGISLAFMFTSIGLSEYYRFESESTRDDFDSRHYDLVSRGFDIGKYISISISSVLVLALSSVVIADVSTKIYNKKQKIEVENKYPSDRGKSLYDTSLQFINMGEIEKSIRVLQSLIFMYPDCDYVPLVYYQLGQNYFILQDYDNALKNWLIFIEDYPLADYYDYILKNIAEIYYIKNNYEKAINFLDRIVFTENILDRETIFSFKAKLDFELFCKEKKNEYFKLAESDYLTLIDNSPNSERLDFYYLKLIELYYMVDNTDKLLVLMQKAEQIENPSVKELVLSYFDE